MPSLPLRITFRDIEPSDAVRQLVEQKMEKLMRLYDRITKCEVAIEAPHRQHSNGPHFRVRIDLTVPGTELVVDRETRDETSTEDLYAAVRDAFEAMSRQVKKHVDTRRGHVKATHGSPHARVIRIFPHDGYGFLEAADGHEVYFHENSVVNGGFGKLELGDEVRFSESSAGENGPQASTVERLGNSGHVLEDRVITAGRETNP